MNYKDGTVGTLPAGIYTGFVYPDTSPESTEVTNFDLLHKTYLPEDSVLDTKWIPITKKKNIRKF